MTRDEYLEELRGLIDSFDDHVTQDDVLDALIDLTQRIEIEGLESGDPS